MEGSAGIMRTALLVLSIAAFVCIEGRNMPAGPRADQPQTFGGLGGDGGMGGMGGMPGIVNGVPGLGVLNPPAFGFGFLNPPGFGAGGWPGMLSPPGLGHGGGGIGGLNPSAIGHGGGGELGFSMLNPPVLSAPVTMPSFGGVADMVGGMPYSTEQGKASP